MQTSHRSHSVNTIDIKRLKKTPVRLTWAVRELLIALFFCWNTSLRTKCQWILYKFTVWWRECIKECWGAKQRNNFLFLHITPGVSTLCSQYFHRHTHSYIQTHTYTHVGSSIEEICDRGVRSWVCAPNSQHPSALTDCINSDCRRTILPFILTCSLCPLFHFLSSSLSLHTHLV